MKSLSNDAYEDSQSCRSERKPGNRLDRGYHPHRGVYISILLMGDLTSRNSTACTPHEPRMVAPVHDVW
jgi:hypothetical protein